MFEAVPYFTDVMKIVMDPGFLKESALEIVLFVIGLVIALFANPTSKAQGRKGVQQNDIFITPLSSVNTGFSGADTYHASYTQNASNGFDTTYGSGDTYAAQDPYASQNTFAEQDPYASQDQNAQNTNSDWRDVYGQTSDNNNNNSGY